MEEPHATIKKVYQQGMGNSGGEAALVGPSVVSRHVAEL